MGRPLSAEERLEDALDRLFDRAQWFSPEKRAILAQRLRSAADQLMRLQPPTVLRDGRTAKAQIAPPETPMTAERRAAAQAWEKAHTEAHLAANGKEPEWKTCCGGCCAQCDVPNPYAPLPHGASEAMLELLRRDPTRLWAPRA